MVNILHFLITWVIFQQFSCRDVKLVAFLIIFHLLNYTSPLIPKLYGNMKQILAYYEVESTPKNEFSLCLITFHGNVLLFVVSLLPLLNWFFEAKRLCQRINYRFVVFVLMNSNTDVMQIICTERHIIMVDDEDRRWW